jgi:hypothetical protein
MHATSPSKIVGAAPGNVHLNEQKETTNTKKGQPYQFLSISISSKLFWGKLLTCSSCLQFGFRKAKQDNVFSLQNSKFFQSTKGYFSVSRAGKVTKKDYINFAFNFVSLLVFVK